ncbi:MAG: 2-oxo acid dehydrogenase subunit E2 [Fimbriimonadaceae bacterium]|nr:2-oxo acid dehydrogenase subunit E2 [Chthonomonadaceae bacterium]MCO5296868.1 2-oxo acid dehydrogenase subunit E2 [Fimbriimonadaceae bacterium]
MTEVIMPKMGDGMEEGTLLEWLKKEGDKVKSGDVIGTIQTDKATLELEAPGSGTLAGLLIGAGDTVPVGQPIGALLKDGEKLPEGWGGSKGEAREPEPAKVGAKPEPEPEARTEAPAANGSSEGRVKSSPLARRIAKDLGVVLERVSGTGPGGRIVEKDVRAAAEQGESAIVHPAAEDTSVKLGRLRRITAERTAHSKQHVPHFYVTLEVDVEKILQLKEQFEEEGAGKVSINDFVARACVLALQEMPVVNATFQGDSVLQYGAVHLGIAAAIDEGLTVPVVRNAHTMGLRELSAAIRALVTKAKENRLAPEEVSGSTFSISNMGMLNVDNFTAIINEPNAAILAVSTTRRKVVVVEDAEDELEIRHRMNLSASFDHRVVDGAVGAKFINVVGELLENPTRLLS